VDEPSNRRLQKFDADRLPIVSVTHNHSPGFAYSGRQAGERPRKRRDPVTQDGPDLEPVSLFDRLFERLERGPQLPSRHLRRADLRRRAGRAYATWRHSSDPIEPPAPVTSTVCPVT
jgi:hypothetical protein